MKKGNGSILLTLVDCCDTVELLPGTARVASKDYVYHVMTHGNNRQTVFKDDEWLQPVTGTSSAV